jgi:hypothetical protein
MQTFNCPNCGAPLSDQSNQKLWLCIYCNSLIRVPTDEASTTPTIEKTISDAEIDEVKELLAEGKRQEAVAAYERIAGATPEDAEKAVETIAKQYAYGVIRRQQLNGFGILLVILDTLALILSLLAWARGVIHPVFAMAIAGFSVFNLLVFERAIRNTFKYLRAPEANAIVQHYAHTSKVKMRGGYVHTFKLLLDVHPERGEPFQDTLIIPVREKNFHRMQQGLAIRVKYIPEEPGSLLFDEIEK